MTEAEKQEIAAAAEDANRIRNDQAFQAAIRNHRASKLNALEREQATVITALLNGQPANIEAIRTLKAEIAAIDGICQEIANAILRAPRKPLSVA